MIIRPYLAADERTWLRCRLLSFADTCYYDDVFITRPAGDDLEVALVAVRGGPDVDGVDADGVDADSSGGDEVLGLIDVTVDGAAATIDSIAVHPDAQRDGVATALLDAALAALPDGVSSLDAWTREDPAANAWYQARGFSERYRYLHVYKSWDEPEDGFRCPEGLTGPVTAFAHAPIELETAMRQRFRRVYVCRQYYREL